MSDATLSEKERIGPEDRRVLRELGRQVAETAALPIQAERARLWKALNQCRPERPMVLAQIGPIMPEPDLQCEEPMCRQWEQALKWKLYRHEHIHDDYPCTDFLDIGCSVEVSDYGVKEAVIHGEIDGFGAYKVDPVIKTPEDLEKLRPRRISVNHEATDGRVETAEDRKRSINRIFFPATSGAIFGPSIRTKEQHCGRVDEGTSLASTDQVLLAAASDRLEGKPAESV